MRVAYLGPAGTFSEDALHRAAGPAPLEPLPLTTIHEAVLAVEKGTADRAFVPFENSIEGSVRPTLDALAFDAPGVVIVGEHDHPVTFQLIARAPLELAEIEEVVSHPQPLAQCARFLRDELGEAGVRAAPSTADAVREVVESTRPWAALGTSAAAEIYDGVVLRSGVEDEPGNVTRFVWLAPTGTEAGAEGEWRTTLVFSELGADHPGALVDALTEFSSREVNLTRIESRPLRDAGLGRYMFFCDLEGAVGEAPVADAIEGLRGKAESVRVLGSYPLRGAGVP
jgi:prephenate dehydratase